MFQIGHRLSYDFDCFSEKELKRTLPRKVKRIFGSKISIKLETSEQFSFLTREKIGITFAIHLYKPLKKPIKTKSIPVFHLEDLVANKAYTIGRRGAWRDYVDLFFILKWKISSFKKIIKDTEQKFNGEFSPKLFLNQLVYFDDLKILPVEFLKEIYTPKQIQNFLKQEVRKYLEDFKRKIKIKN
ncbi:MAG: nucleotidyl transferase AbiEii/AbiGii toxin family protein [Patescibacteria group bacterium]